MTSMSVEEQGSVRKSHVGLAVSDLETSIRFYCDGLGFKHGPRFEAGDEVAGLSEVDPPAQMTSQYLTKEGFRLELLGWERPAVHGHPSRHRNQLGLTHLSFEVDDVEATEDRLLGLGGVPIDGARIRLDRDPAAITVIFLADPDGTRIELLQRHSS